MVHSLPKDWMPKEPIGEVRSVNEDAGLSFAMGDKVISFEIASNTALFYVVDDNSTVDITTPQQREFALGVLGQLRKKLDGNTTWNLDFKASAYVALGELLLALNGN